VGVEHSENTENTSKPRSTLRPIPQSSHVRRRLFPSHEFRNRVFWMGL